MSDYKIDLQSEDGVMFWWGKGAFLNEQIIDKSKEMASRYRLGHTSPFDIMWVRNLLNISTGALDVGTIFAGSVGDLPSMIGFAELSGSIKDIQQSLVEGSTLSRANLYCYKNGDTMLSSVQNFRPGQYNMQSHACEACLSLTASVWTTHPQAVNLFDDDSEEYNDWHSGKESIEDDDLKEKHGFIHDEPTWWQGSLTMPRVIQMENAAIIAYKLDLKILQLRLFGHRTHAWFPKAAFDQNSDDPDDPIPSLTPVDANCQNCDNGKWIFGKVGNGYAGLFSAHEPKWTFGEWIDKELIAEGTRNVFIIQVGNESEYGSYRNFKQLVSRARIHVNGLRWKFSDFECDYDIPRTQQRVRELGPGSDRLELQYDYEADQVRINGQPFDDSNFPRFENKYIKGGRVLWGQYYYTIKHSGHSLTHDFREIKEKSIDAAFVKRHIDLSERSPSFIEQLQCAPQRTIDIGFTNDRPSLAAASIFNGSNFHLFMAWVGHCDSLTGHCDGGIYWSSFDGNMWLAAKKIEGIGSSRGPSLITVDFGEPGHSSKLFMAWKGVEDDSGIYFSQNQALSLAGWKPQERILDFVTSCSPSLAAVGAKVYMAWKGKEDDSGIYYSYFDKGVWAPQTKIPGVGTSDSPLIIALDNRLYLFWKGVDDDTNIYYSWMDNLPNSQWKEQRVVAYKTTSGRETIKIGSERGPAAYKSRRHNIYGLERRFR